MICDFGADHSFHEASIKVKEHYGVEVSASTVRRFTEAHAATILSAKEVLSLKGVRAQSQIVAETDGCFIQIVETGLDAEGYEGDARKRRQLGYREARLSLAHAHHSKEIVYAGTFQSVEIAGEQLADCVHRVGADKHTQVHCVGDGARWIANRVEKHFGSNGHYLIDFYHLCDYLSAASICAKEKQKKWMKRQKSLLKASHLSAVIQELQRHQERSTIPDEEAPVRICLRYIKNRMNQFDYKAAIDNDLPIGSGEIESAHRYVIQKRLKLPGAAWKLDNADKMLALRVHRANRKWEHYWKTLD